MTGSQGAQPPWNGGGTRHCHAHGRVCPDLAQTPFRPRQVCTSDSWAGAVLSPSAAPFQPRLLAIWAPGCWGSGLRLSPRCPLAPVDMGTQGQLSHRWFLCNREHT